MTARSGASGASRPGGMTRLSLFVRAEQLAALKAVQARDGVPVAEQIRRAIDAAVGRPAGVRRRA
jgi:hypothetical protein